MESRDDALRAAVCREGTPDGVPPEKNVAPNKENMDTRYIAELQTFLRYLRARTTEVVSDDPTYGSLWRPAVGMAALLLAGQTPQTHPSVNLRELQIRDMERDLETRPLVINNSAVCLANHSSSAPPEDPPPTPGPDDESVGYDILESILADDLRYIQLIVSLLVTLYNQRRLRGLERALTEERHARRTQDDACQRLRENLVAARERNDELSRIVEARDQEGEAQRRILAEQEIELARANQRATEVQHIHAAQLDALTGAIRQMEQASAEEGRLLSAEGDRLTEVIRRLADRIDARVARYRAPVQRLAPGLPREMSEGLLDAMPRIARRYADAAEELRRADVGSSATEAKLQELSNDVTTHRSMLDRAKANVEKLRAALQRKQLLAEDVSKRITEYMDTYAMTQGFAAYIYLNHTPRTRSYIAPCKRERIQEIRRVIDEAQYDVCGAMMDDLGDGRIECTDARLSDEGFAVPSTCGTRSIFETWSEWSAKFPTMGYRRTAIQAFGVSGSGKTFNLLRSPDDKGAPSLKTRLSQDGFVLHGVYICEGHVRPHEHERLSCVTREFLVHHVSVKVEDIDFAFDEGRLNVRATERDAYEEAQSMMATMGMTRRTFNNENSTRAFLCLIFQRDGETVYLWDIPGAERPKAILNYYVVDPQRRPMGEVFREVEQVGFYGKTDSQLKFKHGMKASALATLVGQSIFINAVLQDLAQLNAGRPRTSSPRDDWELLEEFSPKLRAPFTKAGLILELDVDLDHMLERFEQGNDEFSSGMCANLSVTRFFASSARTFVVLMVRTWLDTAEKRELQIEETRRLVHLLFKPPSVLRDDQTKLELVTELLGHVDDLERVFAA